MWRWICAAAIALVLAGCARQAISVPANVSFGEVDALPSPATASNDSPPRILAMRFSGDTVRRGQTWSGAIVTTTNVASVEVRTNLFSIDVPRKAFGRFAFRVHVFDLPPIFIRAYAVRVIARNSAGVAAEEDLPFRIR